MIKDLKELKKNLFNKRKKLLIKNGILNNEITPFDKDLYQQMNTIYYKGLPISLYIKYMKPLTTINKGFEKSLLMFYCIKDSYLVRARTKDYELNQNIKDYVDKGWIETNNYVYDPTTLRKFNKDLFYKIYIPKDIYIQTHQELFANLYEKEAYKKIRKTTLKDLQPNGNKRDELLNTVSILKETTKDIDSIEELQEYFNQLQIDNNYIKKTNKKGKSK